MVIRLYSGTKFMGLVFDNNLIVSSSIIKKLNILPSVAIPIVKSSQIGDFQFKGLMALPRLGLRSCEDLQRILRVCSANGVVVGNPAYMFRCTKLYARSVATGHLMGSYWQTGLRNPFVIYDRGGGILGLVDVSKSRRHYNCVTVLMFEVVTKRRGYGKVALSAILGEYNYIDGVMLASAGRFWTSCGCSVTRGIEGDVFTLTDSDFKKSCVLQYTR